MDVEIELRDCYRDVQHGDSRPNPRAFSVKPGDDREPLIDQLMNLAEAAGASCQTERSAEVSREPAPAGVMPGPGVVVDSRITDLLQLVVAGGAAAALLRYSSELVRQWLANKGTREMRLKVGDKEVVIKGDVPAAEIERGMQHLQRLAVTGETKGTVIGMLVRVVLSQAGFDGDLEARMICPGESRGFIDACPEEVPGRAA